MSSFIFCNGNRVANAIITTAKCPPDIFKHRRFPGRAKKAAYWAAFLVALNEIDQRGSNN